MYNRNINLWSYNFLRVVMVIKVFRKVVIVLSYEFSIRVYDCAVYLIHMTHTLYQSACAFIKKWD